MNKLKIVLKELRTNANIKQIELAQFLNVRNTTISAWEKGDNEPSIEMIEKLADFFKVSIDYLFGRELEDGTKTYAQDHTGNITPPTPKVEESYLALSRDGEEFYITKPELNKIIKQSKNKKPPEGL